MNDSRPISVSDLHVWYRAGVARRRSESLHAVRGVSFELSQGEALALVGESGSGKTSTIQAVLGLSQAHETQGAAQVAGVDTLHCSKRELRTLRRAAQMIYQDPYEALDPRFTVARTLAEPLKIHKIGTRSTRREAVMSLLDRVGLRPADAFLNRRPHELSGGQRQRVAIAAALALAPRIIVADEPTSMLDVSIRAEILQLLSQLRADGTAIMIVTHDLAMAAQFSDRVAVMHRGEIVESGYFSSVVNHPESAYTRSLLAAVPQLAVADREPAARDQRVDTVEC